MAMSAHEVAGSYPGRGIGVFVVKVIVEGPASSGDTWLRPAV
jgi:hypothetical protein